MPTTQPHDSFMRQFADVKVEIARAALAHPFVYPAGNELHEARRALKAAQQRLARAEVAWAALIAPAAGWAPDPLKE